MPKIFGTSLVGILLATIALYMVGFLWYGIIFEKMWLSLSGITKEAAQTSMEAMGAMGYIWGLLISLAQVLGLAYILHQSNASLLLTCAKIGAVIAVLIALPLMAYSSLYGDVPTALLGLNFGHTLVGYIIACAVISFFRGKDAIGD